MSILEEEEDPSNVLERSLMSLRLVSADYYLAPPNPVYDPTYSVERSYMIKKVPVIRIFGPTASGQKTCVHLHGVFPYFYVAIPADSDPAYLSRLANGIDKTINLSMGIVENSYKYQHVYKIKEVSGVPFYGYHAKKHKFAKIFFFNPQMTKRAADFLLNGTVLGKCFQPHESHIPFVQQFMMDYNLQGMNFLHLECVKFRVKDDDVEDIQDQDFNTSESEFHKNIMDVAPSNRKFDIKSLPDDLKSWLATATEFGTETKSLIAPESSCELEADAVAADILNTNDADGGLALGDPTAKSMNPGLQAIWEDERQRRINLDIDEPLTPPESPPRENVPETESQLFWEKRFAEKLERMKISSQRNSSQISDSVLNDPDSTFNFNPGSEGKKVNSSVYAAESQSDSQAPDISIIERHVESLKNSEGSSSEGRNSQSILSQPIFDQDSSSDEEEEVTLDENEQELAQILAELIEDKDEKRPSPQPPALTLSQQELADLLIELGEEDLDAEAKTAEAEEIKETLEMSQIWKEEDQKEEEDETAEKPSEEKAENEEKAETESQLWPNDEIFESILQDEENLQNEEENLSQIWKGESEDWDGEGEGDGNAREKSTENLNAEQKSDDDIFGQEENSSEDIFGDEDEEFLKTVDLDDPKF